MSDNQIPFLKSEQIEYKQSRKQVVMTNYDPFKFPADIYQAQLHGKARRVCKPINNSADVGTRCQCCLLPVQNQLIPLDCTPKQYMHLGLCYPIYFQIIKMCITLLGIHFIFSAFIAFAINVTGGMCLSLDVKSYICKMSILNSLNIKRIDKLIIQDILNTSFIFISIVILEGIKFKIKILKLKLTEYEEEPSNYSILIKGLPKDITLNETRQFIEEQLQLLNVQTTVVKIYLIFDVKEYVELYRKKRQIYDYKCELEEKYRRLVKEGHNIDDTEKRRKYLKKSQMISEEISETENIVETIQSEISKYEEAYRILVGKIKNDESISIADQIQQKQVKFSGKCIVTLNRTESAAALIKKYKLTINERLIYRLQECLKLDRHYKKVYKGHIIKVVKAPDPSDIIFGNMGSQKFIKLKHRILSNLIIVLILFSVFIIITLGKKISNESKQKSKIPLMYSLIMAIIVSFFNSILGRIIKYFAQDEFYTKQSSYYYTISKRMLATFLVNMLLTTLFSNFVIFYDNDNSTYPNFGVDLVTLINDFYFLNLTNPFLSCVFTMIDYRYYYRLFKRWYIMNGHPVTQAEANLHFEHQPIDISVRFGHLFRNVLFAATISVLLPSALTVSIVVLILVYWNDKYLLLRRYTCQYKLGYVLCEKMFNLLEIYPILFATSNLFVMLIPIRSDVNDNVFGDEGQYNKAYFYIALSALIYALVTYFVQFGILDAFFSRVFNTSIEYKNSKLSYKQKEADFSEDYSHNYPYFRVSQKKNQSLSPTRKALIEQTNKKLTTSVFGMIRDYIDHNKYNIQS